MRKYHENIQIFWIVPIFEYGNSKPFKWKSAICFGRCLGYYARSFFSHQFYACAWWANVISSSDKISLCSFDGIFVCVWVSSQNQIFRFCFWFSLVRIIVLDSNVWAWRSEKMAKVQYSHQCVVLDYHRIIIFLVVPKRLGFYVHPTDKCVNSGERISLNNENW